VTGRVADPLAFVAVRVYVVVVLGVTAVLVLFVTTPIPGLMDKLVAPVVAQDNMLDPPGAVMEGLAVNEEIVGAEVLTVTVTVTDLVTEPAELVAVRV
jgi:hypothetical protein